MTPDRPAGWGSGGGWGAGDDRPPTGVGAGAPEDVPPPRLEPMRLGTLLEVAARIIRRHAAPLLAVSVLFQLPSSLVDAAAQQHLGRALSPLVVDGGTEAPRFLEPNADQARTILEALVTLAGSSVVGALLGVIATLAFTTAVLADYRGRRPTLGAMLRVAVHRSIPALAAALLGALALLGVIVGAVIVAVGAMRALPAPDGATGGLGAFLAILVGVVAAVLAVVLIVRLALPGAVLAGEPGGSIRALRRSWYLTGDNTWRAFGVLATVAIGLTIVGSTLLELLAAVITDGLAAGAGLADLSDALLSALVATLLAPIGGVVLAVLYLDLRVRREGWQPGAAADDTSG